MLRETEIVAKAGAQLAICPDNSARLAFAITASSSEWERSAATA
jgi:hypothetical protein